MSIYTTTRRGLFYLLWVFVGWLAVQALVMVTTDAAPGAIVLFPGDDFIENLPQGAGITGIGSFWIGIRSDQPKLGTNLYHAGAALVLPAGLPGCLPLGAGRTDIGF